MNYIYDIVLNFNNNYFEFFQWKRNDKIINIKKIPVFKVSDSDLYSFKYNIVKVSKDFIDKFVNLTSFYGKSNNNYRFVCLVSNSNETIGVMFDRDGRLIKRSSLVFDEEEEVNDEVYNKDMVSIKYLENIHQDVQFVSRIDNERRDYLYKFINTLDEFNDIDILKYIYYDYFEEEENDIVKIKNKMLCELNKNSENVSKLFELVRLLKKIKN